MTHKPEIILIAAVARNGVIGADNALPWRLRGDLQHFKATTMGHPILMGRATWESLGRPLPGRRNLVVSRQPDWQAPGAEAFASPAAALASCAETEKVFVIGGASLYAQMVDCVDTLLITEVHADVAGDTYFPSVDWQQFEEMARVEHPRDADNEHAYAFVTWRRRTAR